MRKAPISLVGGQCTRTYSGEAIPMVGKVDVEVQYQEQQAKLPLVVVEGDVLSLFGCY